MQEPLIMVVEDDARLRSLLARGLRRAGFRAETVGTGGEALQRLGTVGPDAVVLDVRLPDGDGRDICQAIRERGHDVPVVFLSGHGELADRLAGFDAGGDDYVTKPFMLDELVVRLRAVIRRAGGNGDIQAGGLRLDTEALAAFIDGTRLDLTLTEFRLLASLCAAQGVVRRRDLLRAGWPHESMVRENTLDAHIARLRRKLRDAEGAPEITTVAGVGYSLG
ncbi:MAG: response regulator transcription factor [Actinomycetota bacterium]